MSRFISFQLGIMFLVLIGCAASRRQVHLTPGQHAREFTFQTGEKAPQKYLLYLPGTYGKSKKEWPLMLFLHGAGERGDHIELVKKHGPPKIAETKTDFPFILISPQCPKGKWWSDETQLEFLSKLLNYLLPKLRVDRNRLYLTGLSMGGYGTWALAIKRPHTFAAIAPICGGGDPAQVCKIKQVPVWVFHGGKDKTVPIKNSREMVDALRACGGNVKFTIYPQANHNSWTATYDNPELYSWFLRHRRIGGND